MLSTVEKVGMYTYYDMLSLPFDRDISYPSEISSKTSFKSLKEDTRNALLSLPIVQFTGNFKTGGLDTKQRLYLMSKMEEVYFIDTLKTNYAKCVTQLLDVPDLSHKEVVKRTDEHRNINLIRRSEDYKVLYNGVEYVIEITEEGSGTFTSITYGHNLVLDHMLEADILNFFYKNK
jgi:hypothetical protein